MIKLSYQSPNSTRGVLLIENRQQVGSDTLMPDGGLATWHVNDDIANGWARK